MSKKRLARGGLGLGVLLGLTACGQPAPTGPQESPQAAPRDYSVQQYYNVAPGTGTSMDTGTSVGSGTTTTTRRRRGRGFLYRYYGRRLNPILITQPYQQECANAVAQYNQCVSSSGSYAACTLMLSNVQNTCQQNVGDYDPY